MYTIFIRLNNNRQLSIPNTLRYHIPNYYIRNIILVYIANKITNREAEVLPFKF